MESPLPPVVQRSLGDRSTEKRKNAALEIEALIKSLQEANNLGMIQSVIAVLSKDFCTSMNSNYRKGGLVGLAATAIGLGTISAHQFLGQLLPPVLHCFDDPESRVRYYACESLYNIAKVSRQAVLDHYFSHIWEGLTKLFADVDIDVKNGANLLDRLIKDIVTEADNFHVDQFLPLLQTYIRRTNPFIRQLIVGWITFLDSIPDISMLDWLPEILDGLFNMLSDSNREIRQAADSALAEFLRELASSTVVELGPVVSILVAQCQNPKEPLNRLTAMKWLAAIIHHPYSGGDAILPFHAQILSAILFCISDFGEQDIRQVAERTNDVMLGIVRKTTATFELPRLLETLSSELLNKDDVPSKMAVLRWINMLMEKRKSDMHAFTEKLLPVLLRTLSDPSDAVVLLDLQALSRISMSKQHDDDEKGDDEAKIRKKNENRGSSVENPEEKQFQVVLHAILNLFAHDRQLLETRGSLVIRKLCVLLNAKKVYIGMADTLSSYGEENGGAENAIIFISTMVQTLSIILLTASELHELRTTLAHSFQEESEEGRKVFVTLFHCWCHNPVSTFSLCLLARAFDLSFALVKRFSEMREISVGFLMQIDKLVQLLESPIFIHLRLQLLDVESPHHAALLKSIYGLLMCLPQGDAFRLLNDRLTAVCNLRDNLGASGGSSGVLNTRRPKPDGAGSYQDTVNIVGKTGLSLERLLERFDDIMKQHDEAKMLELNFDAEQIDEAIIPLRSGTANDHHSGGVIGGGNLSPSRVRANALKTNRGEAGSAMNAPMSPINGGMLSGGVAGGPASHHRTHSSSSYQSNSNLPSNTGGRSTNQLLQVPSQQQQYQQNQPYQHRHQQTRYPQQNNPHDERSPRPHGRTRISQ
mmetsp:Transcript_17515/g.47766  ORF Transcript_17515/g.47766 Transcript_17515/m.47766 type:complete len:873 (-) Transcript_17515:1058-3676(-)